MNKIRKYIYKKVLESVLQHPCPDRIPRSGNAGKRVNCYSIEIYNESTPYLLIDAVDDIGVIGRLWTGQEYDKKGTISFEDLNDFKIFITHYYGLCELRSDGIFDYLISKMLPILYIRIWINYILDKLNQLAYNQTNPFILERMQVLEFLIENHIENDGKEINSWKIMKDLYSIQWHEHPKGEQVHKRLLLFLDSLVETGEIKEKKDAPYHYQVKGKAMATLACFELEERRYKESLSLKKTMNILTAFIVILTFFTVVFAGLELVKKF